LLKRKGEIYGFRYQSCAHSAKSADRIKPADALEKESQF